MPEKTLISPSSILGLIMLVRLAERKQLHRNSIQIALAAQKERRERQPAKSHT